MSEPSVRIVEVGPRDGLQNEAKTIATRDKVRLVDALSRTGVDEIEVSSFVAKDWVPQLADAEDVFAAINHRPEVIYSALVPNARGFARAAAVGVKKIAVFTAASESFTQKNINTSIDGSFQRFMAFLPEAKKLGMRVRGYVSTAFWCPYEGVVAKERARDVVARLIDVGCDEISIGDTIGKATTDEVRRFLELVARDLPVTRLALHFHDTYGNAAANVVAGYEAGVRTFDAAVGGLGGCPYAPGAKGNVATDLVVRVLRARGARVNVSLEALASARAILTELGITGA